MLPLPGVERLITGVRAYLTEYDVTANVDAGVRALSRQDNQGPGRANRIIFLPFDPLSGEGGTLKPPFHVGPRDIPSSADPNVRAGTVRAIGDWERQMIVAIWANDTAKSNDEFAQVVAVERLVEWTVRAVDSIGLADVEWGNTKWVVPGERFFGLEVRVGLRFSHPIFDVPLEVGYPDTLTINKVA